MTTSAPPDRPVAAGAQRYEVVQNIGRGAQASTYLARERATGRQVVLKELALSRAGDWKAVELFEREGRVLGSLNHPGIPRYLDGFSVDQGQGGTRFFLVEAYVAGQSLREHIEAGGLLGEPQARALLAGVLDILVYLHGLSPPVVHRDIKPANIILRPDGGISLVDFGAVQEITQGGVGGDTVVGTAGFLPPEQLMGRAQPASDLYALGATVVYAMTGIHPVDIPSSGVGLDVRGLLECSRHFQVFLERLIDPDVDSRLASASEALARLERGDTAMEAAGGADLPVPAMGATSLQDGLVRYTRGPDKLSVTIEPRTTPYSPLIFMAALLFVGGPAAAAWGYIKLHSALLGFSVVVFPLINVVPRAIDGRFEWVRHTVEFTPTDYQIVHHWGPLHWTKRGSLADIAAVGMDGSDDESGLMIVEGSQAKRFGKGLQRQACAKLRDVVDAFVADFQR